MSLGSLQREKVAALSLCSSFREVLHLQLLRARLKESRTHGNRTQPQKQKDLLSFTAPQFNLISNKNDFVSSPAARGSCIAGDEETAKMFFLFCSLQSGKKREIQEGTSWRAMFAPVRSTMFAFSEQANLRFRLAEICFLGSFFAARQRMNIKTAQRTRNAVCASKGEAAEISAKQTFPSPRRKKHLALPMQICYNKKKPREVILWPN